MSNEVRILRDAHDSIVKADADRAAEVAREALALGLPPDRVMNEGFVPGITHIGELFESGQVFLPELMLSARAMEAATRVCTESIPADDGNLSRGIVVIATVQGDVHDVGKAIVIAYLRAYGFDVRDLGRDVPIDRILEEAEQAGAQVIGLSALLTTTMEQQRKVIATLVERGERARFKVVVGGAPVTQHWADLIGADAFAEDAQDGVRKISALLEE